MSSNAFGMHQTWLQCIGCGHRADLLAERQFRCPKCGGLYDVEHNFTQNRVEEEVFMARLVAGFSSTAPKWMQSGVWRYLELVMPFLPTEHIVTLGEGNVPIIKAGLNLRCWTGAENLWLILEGMTPTGSFKDLGMTVLMSVAKAAGIKAVACASTGDTSASLAAYAAAAGMTCAVVLPAGKVTDVQLAQPLVHGAKVITLPGSFDDCMRVIQELVQNYGVYPGNSLNPARIEGHQATVFQLAQFFGWKMPDWIALPVGNGSNCSSVGKGMRLLMSLEIIRHGSRILGCQSAAACPLAMSWNSDLAKWAAAYKPTGVGETTATAARIGNPVSAAKVMREITASDGTVQIASEENLNEAVAVCGSDGIFVCPQTGTALAGVRTAIDSCLIEKDETVVVVATATGLKFTESAANHLTRNVVQLGSCETSEVAKVLQL